MDPPLRVLKDWDKPAATLAGAIAAIEFADEELDKYVNSEAVPRMVKAALAFFKSDHAASIKDQT